MPKIIAVIPVFNESKTLENVLRRVGSRVDKMVCVNDGSTDNSLLLLEKFARTGNQMFIVNRPMNGGMAGALKSGFKFVLFLEAHGIVAGDDIVVTIDADGQHKPEYIGEIVKYFVGKKVDVVLTRRDFSVYPLYKKIGNRFLTWTNSVLSGMSYQDVESGLRFLKVKTIGPILEYYTGVGYSCAQEIALVSARLGFKIDNQFKVGISYYRPGTTLWDGFTVLFMSLLTTGRMLLKFKSNVSIEETLLDESYVPFKVPVEKNKKKEETVKRWN